MATSVAVYFLSKEEYALLVGKSYNLDWHKANSKHFHGYIDDTHFDFKLVDSEKGFYQQAIWSYLDYHAGKQIKDIDVDFMFRCCLISDEFYDNEKHLAKWRKLFTEANPESYLYLEYH